MNKFRLGLIINSVDCRLGDEFDLTNWHKTKVMDSSCGMTGCAGGWATLDHACIKEGLKRTGYGSPMYDGSTGVRALAKFLEIDEDKADELFLPDFYPADRRKGEPARQAFLERARGLL